MHLFDAPGEGYLAGLRVHKLAEANGDLVGLGLVGADDEHDGLARDARFVERLLLFLPLRDAGLQELRVAVPGVGGGVVHQGDWLVAAVFVAQLHLGEIGLLHDTVGDGLRERIVVDSVPEPLPGGFLEERGADVGLEGDARGGAEPGDDAMPGDGLADFGGDGGALASRVVRGLVVDVVRSVVVDGDGRRGGAQEVEQARGAQVERGGGGLLEDGKLSGEVVVIFVASIRAGQLLNVADDEIPLAGPPFGRDALRRDDAQIPGAAQLGRNERVAREDGAVAEVAEQAFEDDEVGGEEQLCAAEAEVGLARRRAGE